MVRPEKESTPSIAGSLGVIVMPQALMRNRAVTTPPGVDPNAPEIRFVVEVSAEHLGVEPDLGS
jgi:hypothetical protein